MAVSHTWSSYVRRVTGSLTHKQIAAQTGISEPTIGRWLRGDNPIPGIELIVEFTRGFSESPVEALVAAGYITAAEAGIPIPPTRTPLTDYTLGELIGELSRRSDELELNGM